MKVHNVKFWHAFFVKMWFKVHRNVNDIRKQIIAFIKKHIIILFTHKSIHNFDRKGIKYRMSYPRWSTSLVVNKQSWSDQSAVDQSETSKRNQLPHDPTILRPTMEYAAMVCDECWILTLYEKFKQRYIYIDITV